MRVEMGNPNLKQVVKLMDRQNVIVPLLTLARSIRPSQRQWREGDLEEVLFFGKEMRHGKKGRQF